MNQKIKLLVIATISLLVSNASFAYGTDYFVVNGLAYADPLHATGTNCKRVYYQDTYANQLSGAVTIPATVTYNGTTYTVTEMGDNCFYGCSKITSVQLGANIQYVCTGAFSGCTNLSYIICKASTPPSFPTSGISSPFPGPSPSQLILYVTDSKVSTYQGTSGWNQFKVVTGENDQTTYGITLNQSTLSLEKGKTSTLSATRVPSFSTGTITWSSSDTNVATVSQGTVTAVGSGSATITASCNGYSATCRVSVSSPVKSISLSFAAMGMERGQSSTLSVTYTPSDADSRSVTWKSSNTSVATVSNGTVTAVGIGSATITATTPNGKTATCGVSVGPASVDLGLPSGTLWAEMNVGSTTPSDPGSYFAWAETTTKSSYTWASLKYCNNGSSTSFSKYTTAGAELSTSDDAAYSVMGSSWKTPSSSELQELIDLCTIESTTIDGQAGYLMTGPNGNTIFLPKNGYKYASSINDGGNCAEYWSRTLSNDIGWANELHIGATGSNITGFSRQYGAGVRPVAANKASRTIATAISMSSTLSLAKGNSSTITVTFTPSSVSSKLLKWVSDNNSVATVDGSGKVTAIASGTAHITATTYDGSNISKTCTVTVTTPVSSISLSQTSLNLIKGGTSTLTVTYNPTDADSRSVTWSSSNTSVATVSTDGLVTAVASGTATITATSANGKTATCTVTVTNPVTSISLSKTSLSLAKGATSTLTVTYNPTDADDASVTWSTTDASVAAVSTDGVVTAVSSGKAIITATSVNGKSASCSIEVLAEDDVVVVPGTYLFKNTSSYGTEYMYESGGLVYSNSDADINDEKYHWIVKRTQDGYSIQNKSTKHYLRSIVGGQSGFGLNQLTTSTEDEVFYFTDCMNGLFVVQSTSMISAGLYLNAAGWGTPVGTYDSNDDTSKWNLVLIERLTPQEENPIMSLSLNENFLSMRIGHTTSLVVTYVPSNADNRSVTWESSDQSVATVSTDGVVTAVSSGKAIITATSVNGKSASCNVEVLSEDDDSDEPYVDDENFVFGHEYVDLGLPSGTLWASCNIGATSPEKLGYRYAWGETTTKDSQSWSNYKYCNGTQTSMTKYCTKEQYGIVDNLLILEPEDDAAAVNWGGPWRMATVEEWRELKANCKITWTTVNGVKGSRITGKNGNSIFLPYDEYWTSTLSTNSPYVAFDIDFDAGGFYIDDYTTTDNHRFTRQLIRPVTSVKEYKVITIIDGEDYEVEEDEHYDLIQYVRNFSNTSWQAMYVPFDITLTDELLSKFQFANINDTHQYDDDEDGTPDRTTIEFFTAKHGIIPANTPCLIRAIETGEYTISAKNTTLYSNEEKIIDCSTVHLLFTFQGVYSKRTAIDIKGCYAMGGGALVRAESDDVTLPPFRFYMMVERRDGSGIADLSVSLRIEGNGEVTYIDLLPAEHLESTKYYDVWGRQYDAPVEGINIVNGKKYINK